MLDLKLTYQQRTDLYNADPELYKKLSLLMGNHPAPEIEFSEVRFPTRGLYFKLQKSLYEGNERYWKDGLDDLASKLLSIKTDRQSKLDAARDEFLLDERIMKSRGIILTEEQQKIMDAARERLFPVTATV